jgi:glycosyltransferase involved in cell wall biosynthesis
MNQAPRVAIVHDWLIGGGAERVVHELHKLYPEAPIYTSYCSDEWRKRLDGRVVTGFLQHWPFSVLRKFLPVLRMWWFEHLDVSSFDVVISSSGNGEAFAVKTPKNTLHINYCHTPTHYYWRHYDTYLERPGFGILDPFVRLALRLLVAPLRRWDYKAAQRPDYYIANSTHIQHDIKLYYGRESTVIHPPIDVDRFTMTQPEQRHGFVIAGRQVAQKRFDLAIKACNQLKLPLTVLGKGPEHERLLRMAGPTVTFVKEISDKEMPGLIANAAAFIFPSFEDFGIVPVEAMAAGTPLIAYRAGGALDYVVEGKTGAFFGHQTVDSLCEALKNFDANAYNSKTIATSAQAFAPGIFAKKIRAFVDQKLTQQLR